MRTVFASLLLAAGCAHAPSTTDPQSCPNPHATHGSAHGGYAHDHPHNGWSQGGHDQHDGGANAFMHRMDFATLVARFEDPGRDAWQKPDEVVRLLGPLSGKVVADLGAGTGYFAVRLLEQAQKVVATDVDERFLAYLRGRVSGSPLRDKLVLRLVGTDRPGLVPEEADVVLVVDVYHHVEDRAAWLRALLAGMRPGGELVIVDFKPGDFPDAPPPSMRIPSEIVAHDLETAGFDKPRIDETTLPRQYVVRARGPRP
jgi:SAM-dependent methyltransferase